MTTTTHDPELGGDPRLIVSLGGEAPHGQTEPPAFFLKDPLTLLGDGPDVDVRLEGTAADLGRIEHDEFDEFVYVHHDGATSVRINGEAVTRHPLRTGDRLELGTWTLSYFREEYADHGRPFGGRQGGEGAHQEPQPSRSAITPAAEPTPQDLTTEKAGT